MPSFLKHAGIACMNESDLGDARFGRVLDPPPSVHVEPLLDEVYDLPEGEVEVQDLLLRQVEELDALHRVTTNSLNT